MGETGACRPGCFRHRAGAEVLHRAKGVAAGFKQDADAVDDVIRADDRPVDRIPVPEIGLDGDDLANTAQGLKMPGEIRPADGHADAVSAAGERTHDVAANKAGPAEDRDELGLIERCHLCTP